MDLRDQIKIEILEIVNKGQVNTTWLDRQSLFTSSEAQIVRSGLHTDGCFNVIPKENGSYEYMISTLGIRELNRLREAIADENNEREKLMYEMQYAKHQAKTYKWMFWVAIIGGICGVASLIVQIFKG